MGSIERRGDKFRARSKGKRRSATFESEDEALRWLLTQEALEAIDKAQRAPETALEKLVASLPKRVVEAFAALPQSPEMIVARSLPSLDQSGVYFLIDGGSIVYVGQAVNVARRIQRHQREGRAFERFYFIPCPERELDALEERYIVALMPKWNRKWVEQSTAACPA